MGKPQSAKRIGVLGHVGNKNLGDEAIIAALIQNIRQRAPDAEVVAFSLYPDDTQERHRIRAFPIRRLNKGFSSTQHEKQRNVWLSVKRKLKNVPIIYSVLKVLHKGFHLLIDSVLELNFCFKCVRNLRGTDLLIFAGSGQLCDHFEGLWGFPYTLLKWSLVARIVGTKVAFVSVGAGPLNSPISRLFIRCALSLATYRSYRDESSKRLVERIGVVSGENHVFPDLALSLQTPDVHSKLPQSNPLSVVGLNPLPFFDHRYWHESSAEIYEQYVRKLACFALWLIRKQYAVLFFPTQLRADPLVIRDIKLVIQASLVKNSEHQLIDRPISTLEDLISAISGTDVVVATRFHGILLSYLLNKPVVGISYQPKTNDLMTQMRQSEYVLDIRRFDCNSLIERFVLLASNGEKAKRQIQERLLAHRLALETQYDRLIR